MARNEETNRVSVGTYGQYSNSNYGAHTITVCVGDVDIWFSYSTVVAFRAPDYGLVLSENIWGPTTGKHLNTIGSYSRRVPRDEFIRKYNDAIASNIAPPKDVLRRKIAELASA